MNRLVILGAGTAGTMMANHLHHKLNRKEWTIDIVDEYGELIDTEEFIKMALEWGQPDGCVLNQEYIDKHKSNHSSYISSYYDKEVDGLRVSSHTEFS